MPRKKPAAQPPPELPVAQAQRVHVRAIVAGAILVAVVVFGLWWWNRSARFTIGIDPDRNVLLVTIDTLRADALGSYGGRASTPNLDRLASHGAQFDFAHAHAVVTLASHASILTGRYPYEHGIRDNTGYRLPASQPTAAAMLKAQGFATGAFVGGFPLDRRFGLNAGFDLYDDHLNAAGPEANDRERPANAVVDSSLGWIARQPGKWFAWVHVYDPHTPYRPPGDWATRFAADPYLGEVSWTDAALGPLFERLQNQSRPTLVIVTADHGESLGEHGELTHSLFAYEATLRVPLIVAELGPGKPGPYGGATGVRIDTPARQVDLLPTILEAVGAPAAEVSGTSLAEVVARGRGADRPSYFEAMTAAVTRGWAPLRGVLVGREKYIDLPIAELYDLAADPAEAKSLVAASPDRLAVLLNALKTFDIAPPARAREETPETMERLRSLGYIGGGTAAVREKYTEADDPKRLVALEQTIHRAGDAFREGRVDDAIAMYRDVIAKRKDTEDAYRRLALVYWRTDRPREAIATLEEALKNGVTQREVRNKLGEYLAKAGQADKAIALLEHDAGDDPDALVALGNAYQLSGRPADAMRAFTRLIQIDPESGLAYENIGTSQLQAKQFAAAETSLRKAIALDASLAGAHTALGVVLASTGRKTEAIEAWKRAIALDAADFNALFNLTINLAETGRRDEARVHGERFVATAPPGLQQDVAAMRALLARLR